MWDTVNTHLAGIENNIDMALLNPFIFHPIFSHITEEIFNQLDNKSLTISREVSKSWRKIIDNKNFSWNRIVKIPTILQNGDAYLHIAARTGQSTAFEKIFNIEEDKNLKNDLGKTPIHLICQQGHYHIAKFLINKSNEFNIKWDVKDK